MRRLLILAFFFLSWCSAASAQNNVQWLGPITAGNCITWFVPGIIKDSGIQCQQVVGITGPNTSTLNGLPLWANTLGTQLKDGSGGTIAGNYTWSGTNNFTGALQNNGAPVVAGPVSSTVGDIAAWNNSGGTVLADSSSFTSVAAPGLALTPLSATTNKGLTVTQSLPNNGSQPTGPFDANSVSLASPGYSVPLGGAKDPIFGIVPHVAAFTAYMNASGPSSGNDNNGLWGAIAETAPVGFVKGITGTAYSNVSASNDAIYGVAGAALVGSAANVQYAVGVLSESISKAGGTIDRRFGFLTSGGNGSNVQGTSADAAYAIETMAAAPFKNGFFVFTHNGAGSGLATNGNIISSDGSFTVGSFAELPNMTCNNNYFNFVNFSMNCAGAANFVGAITPQAGIVGTTTNGGASAGKVGEYVVSGLSALFNFTSSATVTISIASPALVTWTSNPYFNSTATNNGCASVVTFSTTGALPTGLTAGTPYYVTCNGNFTANAFNVSTSVDNAIAGTSVNTSGSQSGAQTGTVNATLSSPSAIDFGGMALTAGDWDVTGVVAYTPDTTTSVSLTRGGITGGTGLVGHAIAVFRHAQAAEVPGTFFVYPTNTERLSLSGTTTVYCGVSSTFTVSTMQATGECRARRIR